MIERGSCRASWPLLLLLVGCVSSPETRFYTLEPFPPDGVAKELLGTPVGIGNVDLPPALDRHAMVVQLSAHRLELREFERWAAPLDAMVPRVLGFDLAARLSSGLVVLPGEPEPEGPMRSLDIVVERFAAGQDGAVVLDARWTLGGEGDEDRWLRRREHVVVDLPSTRSEAIAGAMSTALAELADRIAAVIAAS